MADISTLKPFTIAVPDEQIAELRRRLELTRFPDELVESEWAYGTPLAQMKRLVAYWKDSYEWRKHEAVFNQTLPQFTMDVAVDGFETLNIHFIHKKSDSADAIPLLFIHGWPGSFIEVSKLLPLLTSPGPNGASFHVVAFSLPGYGFSQGASKKCFAMDQYGEVGHKIMQALGYGEYVAQGGDWGSWIIRRMTDNYGGKYLKATHQNMMAVSPPNPLWHPFIFASLILRKWTYSARDLGHLNRMMDFAKNGTGYFKEQSTRPQTLGYSLADSPSGLLAWIYEKLHEWTDNYPWTDDEILTWISIYWFSRAGPAASVRIYYEFEQSGIRPALAKPVTTNTLLGFSWFPKEIVAVPASWLRLSGKVVYEGYHDKGGHFAAYEQPELLAKDLQMMFGKDGCAHNVVSAKL